MQHLSGSYFPFERGRIFGGRMLPLIASLLPLIASLERQHLSALTFHAIRPHTLTHTTGRLCAGLPLIRVSSCCKNQCWIPTVWHASPVKEPRQTAL